METGFWRVIGAVLLTGGLLASPATVRAEEPPCFECHDAFPDFAHKHPPFEEGDCTACHVDHGDEERLMLVADGAALCYECHDEIAGGASFHAPVKEGTCTSCHSPHGSANRRMLVADGSALCATCHGDSPEFKGKVQHTALEDGCDGCHLPHASENPRLLTKNLLTDRIALFSPEQAELCLECHDESSFTAAESEDTGFRMGNRNLHALHLNGGAVKNKYGIIKKKDGQTCYACHQPHTASQERLLRTEYECLGTACFTMRFVKNERGGTCVVGCHKPKTYSRDGHVAGAAATNKQAKAR